MQTPVDGRNFVQIIRKFVLTRVTCIPLNNLDELNCIRYFAFSVFVLTRF